MRCVLVTSFAAGGALRIPGAFGTRGGTVAAIRSSLDGWSNSTKQRELALIPLLMQATTVSVVNRPTCVAVTVIAEKTQHTVALAAVGVVIGVIAGIQAVVAHAAGIGAHCRLADAYFGPS